MLTESRTRRLSLAIATRSDGSSISGLVVEYIVAIDVTRVRFPADANLSPLRRGGNRVIPNACYFSS